MHLSLFNIVNGKDIAKICKNTKQNWIKQIVLDASFIE